MMVAQFGWVDLDLDSSPARPAAFYCPRFTPSKAGDHHGHRVEIFVPLLPQSIT